jgi:hypothetical protein
VDGEKCPPFFLFFPKIITTFVLQKLKDMKKLTKEHIPEGFKFAAVHSNGSAYAYKTEPIAGLNRWETNKLYEWTYFIGDNFDALDWKNSLVSVEEK